MGRGDRKQRGLNEVAAATWPKPGAQKILRFVKIFCAWRLRMYIYNYRLFDRHQCPVASFAVLCDDSSKWRPKKYSHELWGCKVSLSFPTVKLTDYTGRWAELEASSNPFAIVVMSHLKARATRGKGPSRLRWKMHLVRLLYEGGWDRRDVLELFRFIDWVLKLPEALAQQFNVEVNKLETERKMRYVTSIERMGHEQGRNWDPGEEHLDARKT